MSLLDLLRPGGSALVWVGGVAIVAAVSFGGVQTARLANARIALADAGAELAAEKRDRVFDRVKAESAARDEAEHYRQVEQNWSEAQHENAVFARKARDLAAVDSAAAGDAVGRLRERAAALAAAACRDPAAGSAAVAASPAASAPADLLAELPGRLGEAGRLIADYAEAAAISGQQCAADYDALRAMTQNGRAAK